MVPGCARAQVRRGRGLGGCGSGVNLQGQGASSAVGEQAMIACICVRCTTNNSTAVLIQYERLGQYSVDLEDLVACI